MTLMDYLEKSQNSLGHCMPRISVKSDIVKVLYYFFFLAVAGLFATTVSIRGQARSSRSRVSV